MRFGYFDDANREYVIRKPDTPLPWLNYLGSETYFGLISNTAGGYSFYQDARLRRLTRYRYNNVPFDTGGRYIYLRDDEDGKYWSPTWQPTRVQLDEYECRHGLGYTQISSLKSGIKAQLRYFVPLDETLEIWALEIANQRDETAKLSIFSLVEFCLWDAWDDATNYQRNFNTGEVEIDRGVIYHKTEYRERRNHFAYFACSEPLAGFDTQREAFLGAYGEFKSPKAVVDGKCSGSIAHGWAPVGVHHVKLVLAPGKTSKVIYLLGYHENPKAHKFAPPDSDIINKSTVVPVIQEYLNPDRVQIASDRLADYWGRIIDKFQVSSGNQHVDRMVNIWNAYQCMVTFNLSRSASFFESGVGRGMGFRDSNQDLLGFVHMAPERARQRILDLAATQLESGGAFHQYQPLTKRGNDAIGSNFNDDPLWLVLGVAAYLKETGDGSILKEQVPYANQPGTESALSEHLQRAFEYTLERLGPHGLPLIGRADWNDCLNLNAFTDEPGESFQTTTNKEGKVAESVFIAGLFILAAKEMTSICENFVDVGKPSSYYAAAEQMESTLIESGWDGEWFLRAYNDAGEAIGSKNCQEGQIFVEPQGICIMAGVGVLDGRAQIALKSVNDRLATEHGIVLLQPAFSKYDLSLGEISSYPPGYKENAGIFCHTNPWIMIAEAVLGNGDQALDYYLRINPSKREVLSDLHRCEPYVYAQMIAGKDAPTHGEAKNSWLTGTAAWNYVAITQWILGIRPTHQGLEISPTIPDTWHGFTATREFRGVRYLIDVERVDAHDTQLVVDGKEIAGSVVPLEEIDQREVKVKVLLGR